LNKREKKGVILALIPISTMFIDYRCSKPQNKQRIVFPKELADTISII
jgi:hypothetical protein